MGCSNSSINEKIKEKSFCQYYNYFTIDKNELNSESDYGALQFLEIDENRFLVLTESDKLFLYDTKEYKKIMEIELLSTANTIFKLNNEKYLLGGNDGNLYILKIYLTNNYLIVRAFSCEKNITKIIQREDEFIVASYNKIYFFNFKQENELILKNSIENNSLGNEIYNVYIVNNLLLSLLYNEDDTNKNDLIIYDLNNNNKIVYKEEEASIVPWNNTVSNYNSELLIISGNELEIRIFDIKTFKILAEIIDLDFFYSILCVGKKIFCGGNSGKIYEFEYNSKENKLILINQTKIHNSTIFSIARTSSGALVTASRDGNVKFFK